MDTDNNVVKTMGEGEDWRVGKEGEMEDICNSVNNKKMKN